LKLQLFSNGQSPLFSFKKGDHRHTDPAEDNRNSTRPLVRGLATLIYLFAAGILILGLLTFRMGDFMSAGAKGEDLKCYRGIIYRVQQGEGYYQAAHAELSSRGYPTKSVFNWRLPFLGWLLGHIPDERVSRAIPMLLSLLATWLWITLKAKEWPFARVAAGAILVSGISIYTLLDDIYIIHELWAGILIFISLTARAKGWKTLSWASGILALLIRELALPFAAVMTVSSLLERNKQEALAWGTGIIAFFVMYFFHFLALRNFLTGDPVLHFGYWLDFNGWAFVLATFQIHPFLLLLPSWVTSIIVPFALLGFLGWHNSTGIRIRLTIIAYIFVFLFVGKKFNAYWGLIYCNLLPLGLLYTRDTMARLNAAVRQDCRDRPPAIP
jgi:hypothetical protein